MNKKILAVIGVSLFLVGTGVYASARQKSSNPILGTEVATRNIEENAPVKMRTSLKRAVSLQVYGKDKPNVYQVDIDRYLSSNGGTIKLNLDSKATTLTGLKCLGKAKSLWIEGATNGGLNLYNIRDLKSLRSITFVNCKLSPSDISSNIGHLVHYGCLEELYINSSFPGKEFATFSKINNSYSQALNSLGAHYSNSDRGLKMLNLVGNDWQDDISSLSSLTSRGCKITLDSDSKAVSEYNKNVNTVTLDNRGLE